MTGRPVAPFFAPLTQAVRKLEAQFQWRRALSFEPEEEDAERIRRKLEVGLDEVLEEEGAEPLAVANDEG